MRYRSPVAWSVALSALCLAVPAAAQAPAAQGQEFAGRTLMVGTRERPPFVIKNDDGTWAGIAIDLWRSIAGQLGVAYELREAGKDESNCK